MRFNLQNVRFMQYFASLSASLSITVSGTYTAWTSPALTVLTSEDSPIGRPITDDEGSWIVSLLLLAPIFAVPAVAYAMEKYGRKLSLLFSAIPLLTGWFVILWAKSIWWLYAARILAGLGTTFCNIVNSVYIGEIADRDIRGKLSSFYTLLKLVGYLLVYGAGPFVSYSALAMICAAVPVVFFFSFFLMPETPYYLIKVGKIKEAKANLIKLSGASTACDVVDKKLLEIQETVDYDMKNKSSVWDLLKKEYRTSLLIMVGIKTLQQFSGITAIDSYMQTIIEKSSSGISPAVSSLIYGAIQIPGALLSAALVDKVGRKPILIVSSLGCALAMISEGVYFYMFSYLKADTTSIGWLPTTGIIIFALMNNFGVCTLPYVFLGELFATNVKEHASSLSMLYSYCLSFTVSKSFKPLSNVFGMYATFWFFGASCIIGGIYVYYMVPETKGKTFCDIQNKINKRPKQEISTIAV